MNIFSSLSKPPSIIRQSNRMIQIHYCDRIIHPKILISLPINRCRMDLVLPLGL